MYVQKFSVRTTFSKNSKNVLLGFVYAGKERRLHFLKNLSPRMSYNRAMIDKNKLLII